MAPQATATKGLLARGPLVVDGAGNQFLAGAAFALNQNRGIDAGHAADQVVDRDHGRAAAHHLVAFGEFGQALFFGAEVVALHGFVVGAAHHHAQFAQRRRAAAIAESALPNQLIGGKPHGVVGKHNNGGTAGDEAARAIQARFKARLVGVQVDNNNRTICDFDQLSNSGLAGLERDFELVPQAGG